MTTVLTWLIYSAPRTLEVEYNWLLTIVKLTCNKSILLLGIVEFASVVMYPMIEVILYPPSSSKARKLSFASQPMFPETTWQYPAHRIPVESIQDLQKQHLNLMASELAYSGCGFVVFVGSGTLQYPAGMNWLLLAQSVMYMCSACSYDWREATA